ncbi:hypothetical protein F7734_05945 [Scytonema sp. UIC 10036]|uniref:hypothetical protein n=1 Tax=Scytonema sp. UIC 10036 TaxID=2304196 RepID=UPI0012DA2607|nr:hypothetical protein [Scytonema sp. UIC 10036]MUG92026.1 hypothetical protein [Scytonema sp. UIC 10036]
MSIKSDLQQSFMTQLLKKTSLTRTISKFSAIGLVVCSSLSVTFLSLKSSYAYSAFKNNDYYVAQSKQKSGERGNFSQFKYKLAQRETGEQNPSYDNTKNQWGFIGKYQFGEALLIDLGYYQADVYYGNGADRNYWRGRWTGKDDIRNKEDFLNNKNNVQEKAINQAFALQWSRLKAELQQNGRSVEQYLGKSTRGIAITTSGLIAASHLRGPRATAEMLLFDKDNRDERGTSIFEYLNEFAGYQIK